MNNVFIVYKENSNGLVIQSVYSNELEALKEANYYNINSNGASDLFYVKESLVNEIFEI